VSCRAKEEQATLGLKSFGVDVPEDEAEAVITEVPLFDRTHAPRTNGSGPGRFRSAVENDFDRSFTAVLGLLDSTAAFEISAPFL